ncbi:MAG: hypothetical protein ABSE48_15785, partial [Verrucomicrobiota bacterium]
MAQRSVQFGIAGSVFNSRGQATNIILTRMAPSEPCAQSQFPFSAVGGSSKEHPLLRTHAVWLVPVLSAFCLASPLPAQIA